MMPRYIDADEYRKRLEMICGDGYTKQVIDIFIDWFMSIAESTESEDVAPVIHAHWVHRTAEWNFTEECSKCHFGHDYRTPFCPICGAKMDEVTE